MAHTASTTFKEKLRALLPAAPAVANEPPQPIVRTAQPRVGFERRAVQPPTAVYLTENDFLQVIAEGSLAGTSLIIQGRFLNPDGRISYFSRRLAVTSDRLLVNDSFILGECFLLGIIVYSTTPLPRATCYVKVSFAQGTIGAIGVYFETLLEGYVDGYYSPTWPMSVPEHEVSGFGYVRTVVGSAPAAGAEILESVPTNARWIMRSVRLVLTTSSTVATRMVQIVLDDGTNAFHYVESPVGQLLSTVVNYACGDYPSFALASPGTINRLPLPPMALREGYRFRTNTIGLQAGDSYAAPVYTVEEWLEP